MASLEAQKSAQNRITTAIIDFYDQRAATYEGESDKFHVRLARDLVDIAVPLVKSSKRGAIKVLDLCCGTGMVSFAARDTFGPDSIIHGVDISSASLQVAKKKVVEKGCTNMEFFHCSATDLESLSLEKESYCLITCCSALVLLLEDLPTTLRKWATYLQPGGVMVFDVPVAGTQIVTFSINVAIASQGAVVAPREWIKSEDSVMDLIVESGLKCYSVSQTQVYKTVTFKADEAAKKWTENAGCNIHNLQDLEPENREAARKSFIQMIQGFANNNGLVKDQYRLYLGVGMKE